VGEQLACLSSDSSLLTPVAMNAPMLPRSLAAQPGALVLDVRPLEQFNICHLPGEAAGGGALHNVQLATLKDAAAGRGHLLGAGVAVCCAGVPRSHSKRLPLYCTAGAMHTPYKHFDRHLDVIRARLATPETHPAAAETAATAGDAAEQNGGAVGSSSPSEHPPFYVVCRRGNDSQRALAALRRAGISQGVDVVGGMEAWAREVDTSFPMY